MLDLYKKGKLADLANLIPNPEQRNPALYQPSQDLQSAVSAALALGLPLLLTGEPGTGKTDLAHHLAHHFGLGEALVFHAQTTSTSRDLFYKYDALAHFQYSQTQREQLSADEVEGRFIRFEALGKAIKDKRKVVVLLDEIDKAPRDLPNDVLAALEDLSFKVAETGRVYATEPSARPIIIMTSNSEKNLPDAFLRRVAYFHVPFPNRETLLRIVQSKTAGLDAAQTDALIDHFRDIRDVKGAKMRKKPATAELLMWSALLTKMAFPVLKLDEPSTLTAAEKDMLRTSYSVLAKNREDLNSLKDSLK